MYFIVVKFVFMVENMYICSLKSNFKVECPFKEGKED